MATGVILSGGENTRMPVSKSFLEVKGERIIDRILSVLKKVFSDILISTNAPELYIEFGVPLFGDVYNIRGPMSGIFTALFNSREPWIFVCACDMPFISEDVIRYLMSKTANNHDAVVPVVDGKIEPLFAFYSKRLLDDMEKALLSGSASMQRFLKNKNVAYIDSSELKAIDPGGKSFVNLNTPEDFRRETGGEICLV